MNDILKLLKLFNGTKEFEVLKVLSENYPKKITNYKIARCSGLDRKTTKAILEKFEKQKAIEKFCDTEHVTYRLTKEYVKISQLCLTVSKMLNLSHN
jgi:DNA-binding IclR family transcriptional regulator